MNTFVTIFISMIIGFLSALGVIGYILIMDKTCLAYIEGMIKFIPLTELRVSKKFMDGL